MPNINGYNGIDMANIASINGQDVPSGGGGVSESSTGVLYFESGGFNTGLPEANAFFGDSAVNIYKGQISSRTDIVKIKSNPYQMYALDSSGNLYSAGWTNTSRMGRTTSGAGNEDYKLVQCLTSVAKFAPFDQGCFAIKTNGTLWWCGSLLNYANNGDTGQGTTTSPNYGWYQYGTDTDWIDVDAYTAFPAAAMAIKGGTGSEYLYVAGSNYYGKTGLGTQSGNAKPWTRVKSDSSTNWSETISKIDMGQNATLIVTKSGKLFAIGDGNDGALGQGNTTDYYYPVQVGTDTDWDIPYAKSRLCSYAIKTDGSLYASRGSTFYFKIGPATSNRTYQQVGSDTDYEELVTIQNNSSMGADIIFAKKNGTWYANWDTSLPAGLVGNTTAKTSPGVNTWVTINTMLDGNDIDVGINTLHITYKSNNAALGETLLIATAAT